MRFFVATSLLKTSRDRFSDYRRPTTVSQCVT